ncbi:MAG: hypothetical protein IPK53_11625 [bacterium]|nr:hypothetical protein [bacterium]
MNQQFKRGRPRSVVHIKGQSYPLDFRKARTEFIQQYLATVLTTFDGNISATARALGLSRRSVQIMVGGAGSGTIRQMKTQYMQKESKRP